MPSTSNNESQTSTTDLTDVPTGYKTFTWNEETFKVKVKFKRLKFLRLISENPVDALSLAFDPEDFDALEGREMDEAELEDLLEIVAKTLLGKSEEK